MRISVYFLIETFSLHLTSFFVEWWVWIFKRFFLSQKRHEEILWILITSHKKVTLLLFEIYSTNQFRHLKRGKLKVCWLPLAIYAPSILTSSFSFCVYLPLLIQTSKKILFSLCDLIEFLVPLACFVKIIYAL